jgi:transposase
MGEKRQKREFTKEFKERAVELALKGDRKQSEIAGNLGIDGNTLSRWKREIKQAEGGSLKAFPGKGKARDEEVARLRKENEDLRETNEILKKAMAIFTVREPR